MSSSLLIYLVPLMCFYIWLPAGTASSSKRVCYYTNWSQYRKDGYAFLPEDVDASLCTHVVFAFAKISGGALRSVEWNDEPWGNGGKGLYTRLNALKRRHSHLKVLLAVGGWSHGVTNFTTMVETQEKRLAFIRGAVTFLRTHSFDGLDYDWEFPNDRGSPPQDKIRFTLLLKETMDLFHKESSLTGNSRLLVTAAVGMQYGRLINSYEATEIHKYLDFINLMAYDLNDQVFGTNLTVHHSALYNRSDEVFPESTRNVDWGVQFWLRNGVPPHKLVLGLALYGKAFTLESGSENTIGSPFTGHVYAISFYQICLKMASNALTKKWEKVWDEQGQVPYIYNPTTKEWIGYEDQQSIAIKVRYLLEQHLGGFMIWALDLDGFKEQTCGIRYPLLTEANKVLKMASTTTATTSATSRMSPLTSSTTSTSSEAPSTSISTTSNTIPETSVVTISSSTTKRAETTVLMVATDPIQVFSVTNITYLSTMPITSSSTSSSVDKGTKMVDTIKTGDEKIKKDRKGFSSGSPKTQTYIGAVLTVIFIFSK